MNFPRSNVPSPYSPQYQTSKPRLLDFDLSKFLESLTAALSNVMEKGIKVDDNMDVYIASYVSNATPDTEDTIAHTLRRVPIGIWVIKQNKAGSFYAGPTSWTDTNIYLKCNVASVDATVVIF